MKTIHIVEHDHGDGIDLWAATTKNLANVIIDVITKERYDRRCASDADISLEDARADWWKFTGETECFHIRELKVIDNIHDALKCLGHQSILISEV